MFDLKGYEASLLEGAWVTLEVALASLLLRVSEMVCELPELREMDINPIIVDENGAISVDARIVVGSSTQAVAAHVSNAVNGYQHLAIMPYPARYRREWPMPGTGGGIYIVRPVHPNDAQMLQALVQGLSPESRWFRFVSRFHELPPSMLSRFTLIDYDREMALVAIVMERSVSPDGTVLESERIVQPTAWHQALLDNLRETLAQWEPQTAGTGR